MDVKGQARREVVESRIPDLQPMYVAGEWREASDAETMDVVDPSTEAVFTRVPRASASDVDDAVAAARAAQVDWAAQGWQSRAEVLNTLADRVAAEREELAELEALDAGLAYSAMGRDIDNSVAYLRYYAGLGSELKGETVEVPGLAMNLTLREPYGVVGRIVPFNHPLQFAAQAIAAPLAAGNGVVLKPADQTPMTALKLAELAAEVLPQGLVSVVTGDGAVTGHALVSHADVRRIGFTGSIGTARHVMRDAADQVKSLSFELGGKNPMIVFADADPVAAAAACVQAMNLSRCQGQSCGSPSRVFVHEAIKDEFSRQVVEQVSGIRLGDALDGDSQMGPLAFRDHYDRVMRYVSLGTDQGATLLAGGVRPRTLERGYFLEPTVFSDVQPDMAVAREEIFGPVIALMGWTDLDAVIGRIHELPYGLTANVWTNDLNNAMRMAHTIKAGYIQVNGRGQRPFGAPFGGYGLSGLGRENDLSELLSYTQVKNVFIDLPPGR